MSIFLITFFCQFPVWAPQGQSSAGWPKTSSASQLLSERCNACWYEPVRLPTWTAGRSRKQIIILSLFTKRCIEHRQRIRSIFVLQPPLLLASDLCVGNAAISWREGGSNQRLWPLSTSTSYVPAAVVLLHLIILMTDTNSVNRISTTEELLSLRHIWKKYSPAAFLL